MRNIKIHFVENETGKVVGQPMAFNAPGVGDEIRLGGEGNERYYKVTRRIWVYDEETGTNIDRVNIGVTECA